MPKTRAPYAPEFRRQMVDLVRAGRDPDDLAREFGPTAQSIRNWVAVAGAKVGGREEKSSAPADADELVRLRREVRQQANTTNSPPTSSRSSPSLQSTHSGCDWVQALVGGQIRATAVLSTDQIRAEDPIGPGSRSLGTSRYETVIFPSSRNGHPAVLDTSLPNSVENSPADFLPASPLAGRCRVRQRAYLVMESNLRSQTSGGFLRLSRIREKNLSADA